MGEVNWRGDPEEIEFSATTWLAQTFTPLWSHECSQIRIDLKVLFYFIEVKASIQHLTPDGWPTGAPLAEVTFTGNDFTIINHMFTFQKAFPKIRLVEGIKYALVLQAIGIFLTPCRTMRVPPSPGGYPRGKLIRSINAGLSWDITDLGDLLFAEFGDPPLVPSEYVPPIKNWAVQELRVQSYFRSACIRVATTEPCILKCLTARREPVPRETWILRRGVRFYCYKETYYPPLSLHRQLESGESLYHTFYIGGLFVGKKYWITFTAEANFKQLVSGTAFFTLTHPHGAPPMTDTIRPNAPGTYCDIRSEVGDPCPDHYKNVDDTTPDGNETMVFNWRAFNCYCLDTYKVQSSPITEAPIDYLEVIARFAWQYGYAYASGARIVILTHGTLYRSDTFSPIWHAWTNYTYNWYVNPFTHEKWTAQEVNDVEIGIELRVYWGVGWHTSSKCTQVYAKIHHICLAYN